MTYDLETAMTDLHSPVSFGGGGGRGGGGRRGQAAISRKMNRDNSATSRSDVSKWNRRDVLTHSASNIGNYGNNYARSVGACTGCHEGRYDAIGGSNHTFGRNGGDRDR